MCSSDLRLGRPSEPGDTLRIPRPPERVALKVPSLRGRPPHGRRQVMGRARPAKPRRRDGCRHEDERQSADGENPARSRLPRHCANHPAFREPRGREPPITRSNSPFFSESPDREQSLELRQSPRDSPDLQRNRNIPKSRYLRKRLPSHPRPPGGKGAFEHAPPQHHQMPIPIAFRATSGGCIRRATSEARMLLLVSLLVSLLGARRLPAGGGG